MECGDRKDHLFKPCGKAARERHSHCVGAYRNEDGASVRCTCDCHGGRGKTQNMFDAPVIRVQRSLF